MRTDGWDPDGGSPVTVGRITGGNHRLEDQFTASTAMLRRAAHPGLLHGTVWPSRHVIHLARFLPRSGLWIAGSDCVLSRD